MVWPSVKREQERDGSVTVPLPQLRTSYSVEEDVKREIMALAWRSFLAGSHFGAKGVFQAGEIASGQNSLIDL